MDGDRQAEVPRTRWQRNVKGLSSPAICATIGCGDLIKPGRGCLYCPACLVQREQPVDDDGPADAVELDIASPLGVGPRGNPCAHRNCGQPTLRGRLYCSTRCRGRAQSKKARATITIDGVEATLREHAQARGIDIGTVWCRLRGGATPEEAVTMRPKLGRPKKNARAA